MYKGHGKLEDEELTKETTKIAQEDHGNDGSRDKSCFKKDRVVNSIKCYRKERQYRFRFQWHFECESQSTVIEK